MSIDRALRRLEGVASTVVKAGPPTRLEVSLKPGAWVDPSVCFGPVSRTGYQAKRDDVLLLLTGRVEQQGDRLVLRVDDVKPGPQVFVLHAGKNRGAYDAVASSAGKPIQIEAAWRAAKPGAGEPLAELEPRQIVYADGKKW